MLNNFKLKTLIKKITVFLDANEGDVHIFVGTQARVVLEETVLCNNYTIRIAVAFTFNSRFSAIAAGVVYGSVTTPELFTNYT